MTEPGTLLAGKVAIVTGAGGGIGRATALRLAADGASVAVVDLDEVAAKSTRHEIEAAGGAAIAAQADVSLDEDCRRIVELTHSHFGALDVVVNNAGVLRPEGTVAELAESDWDRIMSVSLKSVFLTSRHAVPLLRRGGGGVVVNLASVHAFATIAAVAAYAAAKGGVVALTRQMALDLAPDRIRVVAVAPGAVDTAMLRGDGATDAQLESAGFALDGTSIGRVGQPHEIANVIAWAVSSEASFVTGTTLVADGGLLARLVS